MTSSVGLHIDHRRFHMVALEGTAKKHRVKTAESVEIPPDEDPVDFVAAALKRKVREEKLRPDEVQLAVDSGLAAFRHVVLPFDDRAKIEEVLKFEVESHFPQWDIDDVIVDFLVLSTKPGVESSLLVTALPKARLERQLAACESGGLEAGEAELDGTALFNAAAEKGLLAEDAAQVLVHVGDSSTTVVVTDGGRLASMRAIRAGARPSGASAFLAEEEGEPGKVQADDAGGAGRRLEETVRRIRRELGRTISGAQTRHPIEAVYLAGHDLPGLAEGDFFEVPVHAFPGLPEAEDEEGHELAVAYGAALRGLGVTALQPHLRREELRFTGKFERLELPLAVFSLLLFTLLAVKLIVINKQILWRDEGDLANQNRGDMQIWLEACCAYLLPNPENGTPGRLKNPPEEIVDFAARAQAGEVTALTKWQELSRLRSLLEADINEVKRDLGQVTSGNDALLLSSLQGMTLVMNTIDGLGETVGRFGIRQVEANYQVGRAGSNDTVEVRLDMDFFAEDDVEASRNYNAMKRAIEAEYWCLDFPDRPSKPFPDGGGGISVDGITITVDVLTALTRRMGAS